MTSDWSDQDVHWMQLALAEAAHGRGFVEPNPMVGCVVVRNGELLSSGYHHIYGGPHAEVDAIAGLPTDALVGATVYVTLEPCSHFGKTPPCANFLAERRPKKVVVAMQDPFPEVAGRGIELFRKGGIEVAVGLLEKEARQLNAAYLKLISTGRPWVIAKWAMTLDGAIATATGDSKWISNASSRAAVHAMRGNVDAILTGIGTVLADDPMLNVRLDPDFKPPRTAIRIVLDRNLRLPPDSKLVQTAAELPLVAVCSSLAPAENLDNLKRLGVEIWQSSKHDEARFGPATSLHVALDRLGSIRATNVLLEAGANLLGTAIDEGLIDQIECFIAPKIVGGQALRPVLGKGVSLMQQASRWDMAQVRQLEQDIWTTLIATSRD